MKPRIPLRILLLLSIFTFAGCGVKETSASQLSAISNRTSPVVLAPGSYANRTSGLAAGTLSITPDDFGPRPFRAELSFSARGVSVSAGFVGGHTTFLGLDDLHVGMTFSKSARTLSFCGDDATLTIVDSKHFTLAFTGRCGNYHHFGHFGQIWVDVQAAGDYEWTGDIP